MKIRAFQDTFDTELLGQKCFKVLLSDVDDVTNVAELATAVSRLSDADIIYLSTTHEPRVIAEVQRLGFVMVTTRNVYARSADAPIEGRAADARTVKKAALRESHEIGEFSRLIGSLVAKSRYWKDERIPRNRSLALYERWFYNSIYADFADEVVAAVEGTQIQGLVTLKKQGRSVVIDLIVVDEAAQGRGIGRLLVRKALAYCASERLPAIRVETESENIEANRFYQELGFVLDAHTLAFHYHPSHQ